MSISLKIKVTKEILFKSRMCGVGIWAYTNVGSSCAVALAVLDIFPKAWVKHFYIELDNSCTKRIPLPMEATQFILEFDRATPELRPLLNELEFEIDIPDEVLEQINLAELRPLLINHPTLELV